MTHNPPDNPLDVLIARLGLHVPAIAKARDEAGRTKARMADALADAVPQDDASVVVFGSLARNELTFKSDTDWTLLVDGQASDTHADTVLEVGRRIVQAGGKDPGREGTFGHFAFSHDLLHRIGGINDSNANLTQRMLLVLESGALGPDGTYHRVLRGVLRRYVVEDAGLRSRQERVPRFLLNDVVRYWRTIAVDAAHKRRDRGAEGWALRTLKLQTSRKLMFSSGMLSCFSCAFTPAIANAPADAAADELIEHVLRLAARTPLERMAEILLSLGILEPARELLTAYDEFLSVLDSPEEREYLETLPATVSPVEPRWHRIRNIGSEFQAALDQIFFEGETPIPLLTRKYGVF
jgi:hypothetical protein